VEDSPTGVASAEAAGCVTVAVEGLVPVPPAPGRITIGSLRDLTVDRLQQLVPRAKGHDTA
jgi:beta-phosphoglucomutase-like phosphatase (HAD superfamily)